MSRNLTRVPASVFSLRAFAVSNALTLSGAFYTGHYGLWSLSILLSLATLASLAGSQMPQQPRDAAQSITP